MASDILLIFPTRARPAAALRTLASIIATTQGRVDVVLCQDEDDPKAFQFRSQHVFTRTGSPRPFTHWLNAAALEFCNAYSILGWTADDIHYPQPHWDFLVRGALHDTPGLVYGQDGIQNEKLPTHPFVSSVLVQTLGHLIDPRLRHYFNDNYLKELTSRAGCLTYRPDLVLEHRHHSTGGRKADALTIQNEMGFEADRAAFTDTLTMLDARASLLRTALERFRCNAAAHQGCGGGTLVFQNACSTVSQLGSVGK